VLLKVPLAFVEDSDLQPVIHRHLSLVTHLVNDHLARPHVERHLPGSGFGLLRRGPLRLEFPERVLLEEIA